MKWISVNNSLPVMTPIYKDGPKNWRGLIFTGSFVTAGYYEESYKKRIPRWKDSFGRSTSVTHWMPFPAPPKEEEEKQNG